MRCPHCSYVSFEYLNTCKKCSKDLTAHKSQYGIDFVEPIPLGILTFIETDSQEQGSGSPDDIATFTSGEDVYLETGEAEAEEETGEVAVEIGDETSDEGFHFDLGDSTDEYGAGETMVESPVEEAAAEEAVEIDGSAIEVGEMEEAPEAEMEIPGESSAELEIDISDTGEGELGTGELTVDTGDLEADSGELAVDTGDLEADSGELAVDTGDLEADSGELAVDTGDLEADSGELAVDTGDLEADSGELAVDTGDLEADSGELAVDTGDLAIDTGDLEVAEESPGASGIELSEDFDESIASDSGFSLGLGEDFSSDDEEIDFSSFGGGDSADGDISLGLEDSGAGEAEKKPGKGDEADDFDEIELSLDDKDMMDSGGDEAGDDLDLGDLSIEMEEDK